MAVAMARATKAWRRWARSVTPSALLAAAATVPYGLTLCPTVSWYDSAEFSASATTLRVVPHPPGYPLYTILGHVFTWLPGEPAWGLNVMSLVFAALSVFLLVEVARKLGMGWLAALTSGAVLAVAPSFWENAVKAEVYTPGLAWLLAVLLGCLHAAQRADLRWAWGVAFAAGVGLGVHMSLATYGLGFAAILGAGFWRWGQSCADQRPGREWLKLGLGCALAAALGGLVFLLIPFGPFDTVTPLGPYPDSFNRMWIRFVDDLSGGVFRSYFKPMPLAVRLQRVGHIAVSNLGYAGLLVASVGGMAALRQRRAVAVALGLGVLGNVAFFFRYDVPDLDVFLLPSLVSLALGVGLGIDAIGVAAGPWVRRATVLVLVLAATWNTASQWDRIDLSDDRSAREFGERACATLPPGAVLAMTSMPSEWKPYSVLLYMHEAQLGCRDTEFWGLATIGMINDALMRSRPVYAYVPAPRFSNVFDVEPEGSLFRVRRRGDE